MLEVLTMAALEYMVVTGLSQECKCFQDFGVCRWVKPSHLQYTVHEAGITYLASSVKSTVDNIMVRQGDKVKVRNVAVIPNEKCLQQHKLLVMYVRSNTTKRWHKKFKPRVHVW